MKSVMQVMSLLWDIAIAGCGDNVNQVGMEDTALKTQRDALKNAKQIDHTLLNAAAKQKETIEENTQ